MNERYTWHPPFTAREPTEQEKDRYPYYLYEYIVVDSIGTLVHTGLEWSCKKRAEALNIAAALQIMVRGTKAEDQAA